MKDEELAEEIANRRCHEIMCYGHCSFNSPKHHRCGEWHREYNCALEGLKAGRPQWHTPDARLPEEEGDYLFYLRDGEETMYDIVGVSIDGNGYVSLDSHIWSITDVIAWCELPTFDKE